MATYYSRELPFMDKTDADVIFVVDGQEMPGHRTILSQFCPYFDKLLYEHPKESHSTPFEIKETSAKAFKELLRFIYKGQLELSNWTIEDVHTLLALARKYEFPLLFVKVVELLDDQQWNFDTWTMIKDFASLCDSDPLKAKCISYAEAKIDDFLIQKDLEKFSADFVCSMFDLPKVSTCDQDKLLGALFKWKNETQKSAEIISLFQKISWEKVSSEITSVLIEEFFSKLQNPDEYLFWTLDVPLSKKESKFVPLSTEKDASKFVVRLENIVLTKGRRRQLPMANCNGSIICSLSFKCLEILLKLDDPWFEIAVKSIEFEAETNFNIESIRGRNMKGEIFQMVVSEVTSGNGCFKYNAVFSDAKPVSWIRIFSQKFKNMSELRLRSFVIHKL